MSSGGGGRHYDDDEKIEVGGATKRFKDWDCPSCNANNPCEGIGNGDEVLCNYCGTEFLVKVNDEGKMKLRET
jgi:DNA-directed RNA polymerase subunit RPC12/RpoP